MTLSVYLFAAAAIGAAFLFWAGRRHEKEYRRLVALGRREELEDLKAAILQGWQPPTVARQSSETPGDEAA